MGEAGVPVELGGLAAETLHLPKAGVQVDLAIFAAEVRGQLSTALEFNSDLFDGTTAARMAGQLTTLLGAIVEQPAARLSELPLLDAAERQALLVEWNDTRGGEAGTATLHDLFAAQVRRAPEAPAVLFAGESLTYGELDLAARRVASGLFELGIRPGAQVAVWLRRGLDLVPVLLGILKAGAAYVPLEPEWPAERCHHILESLGITCLVTDSSHLRAAQELLWRLPRLRDSLCMDLRAPRPEAEPIDTESVRALFDLVSERAVDRVSAGGFVSSYTGQAFADAEVDEYLARVLGLARPHLGPASRVLEIGCGSGLLTFALAGEVARYVALDPSAATQARNQEKADAGGGALAPLELVTGFAHEIERFEEGSFDLILIASTVQFFPGLIYLERVIETALGLLAPGGVLLLADLLDLRQRAEFRASLEEFRRRHRDDLSLRTKTQPGNELHVDEDFFADLAVALPGLAGVQVCHRETGFDNELRFRYDVVLRKAAARAPALRPGGERLKAVRTRFWLDRLPLVDLPETLGDEALAYITFTSGSTGVPKGVAVRHRPVVNLIDWVHRSRGIGPEDRVLFVTSLCFDLSVYDVFGLLAAGGSIHVVAEDDVRDPQALMRLLLEEPITLWDSAPAALQQLVPFFPAPGTNAGQLRLRQVFLSGDWIPVGLPDAVRHSFPAARVLSLGGATEATVWSNFFPVASVDPLWRSIPYGRPIENARYHVLDSRLAPCPIGVAGDLYIGGGCLASHYSADPEQTAYRFLPDPLGSDAGGRIYRTGDRSRYLADGNLEFLGRTDSQVKIRGYRIEQGEIEVALAAHPEVGHAAVVVREDTPGEKRLVAYFVPHGGPAPKAGELRSFLREKLPEYMMPAAFVPLAALPVTANGKLDRQALPVPGWRADAGTYVAPRTAAEERLCGIWVAVLGHERVGVEDNFFALGGHSLLATQVVSRVRETFGVELPLLRFFERPTVAALAALIEATRPVERPGLPLVRAAEDEERVLSFSQERLWFLDQLEPGRPTYNMPVAVALRGALAVAALAASLGEIVRRHEVLRTRLAEESGRPRPVVEDAIGAALPVVDLTALLGNERERVTQALAAAEALRPFDLAHGPVLRATLLRLSESEHRLLFTLHHIASDGWSLGVLVAELSALYGAFSHRVPLPSPLPELPLQYSDYALWQRRWLSGEVLAAELAYWRQRLASAPALLELPADRPRPTVASGRAGQLPFRLAGAAATGLLEGAVRQGATLFMAALAALAALLSRLTGREDLSLGAPIAGRTHHELEGLIGFFVNTLVLRVDAGGDPSFGELLDRVRGTTLDAYVHQDLPFERLVEELAPERSLVYSPLFQVMLNLQNTPFQRLSLPGLELDPVELDSGRSKFDLTLTLAQRGDELHGSLRYSRDLFDPPTALRLLGQLEHLLAAAVAEPARGIASLPLLNAAEQHQLVVEWSDTGAASDGEAGCLHELFLLQAGRSQDAVAVVSEESRWTFGELARRSGRLAERLRALGVGPESPVALCAERSFAMVVGLLGVLRAGGAYVPLDPAHPRERLALLLADVQGATPQPVLLVEAHLAERLPERPGHRLVLEDPAFGGETGPPSPAAPATPENAAYVIFTSGSTGLPKGVVVEHRQVVNYVRGVAARTELAPDASFALVQPLTVDSSKTAIFPPLLGGGTLHLISQERALAPGALAAYLRRHEVGGLKIAPSHLAALQGASPTADLLPHGWLIFGGEASRTDWALDLARSSASCRVFNHYGPTEATVGVLACRIAPDLTGGPTLTTPLGRPLANSRSYLLDRAGQPVPPGTSGELHLGGAGIARGYHGRPDLTAERFVPDLFAPEPGARLYRTGDLARFLADGRIEFLGRIDGQVKIRGFRIELGEIEAELCRHEAVREAIVAVPDEPGQAPRLVAYVVPRDAQPAPSELPPFLERASAGIHGAGGLRLPRRPAAERPWQGRPPGSRPGAARAGARSRGTPGAANPGGGESVGDLGRGAEAGMGGGRGQLLHPRRTLAPRRPGGVAHPRHLQGRAAAAAALRAADDRWPRRGDRPRAAGGEPRATAPADGAATRDPPLLRPGETVVPRSARSRLGDLQHPSVGAPHRRPGAVGSGVGPQRGSAPARGAADDLPGGRRPSGAGHRSPGRPAAQGSGLNRAAGGTASGGDRSPGGGRRGAPLRPVARPPDSRRPPAPRRRPACPAPQSPPHRFRRLVAGGAGPRGGGALSGLRRRETLAAPRAARCSMPISPSGSGAGWPAKCSRARSAIGGNGSPAPPRCLTCRSTGRARRSLTAAPAGWSGRCRHRSSTPCGSSAGARSDWSRPSSWSSSPPGAPACPGSADRRRWSWGLRSPTAPTVRSKGSSASSSTPWRSARISREILVSPISWAGCGGRPSPTTPTRISLSNAWWARWPPSGASATRRSSRSSSPSRTPRQRTWSCPVSL